MSDPVLVTGGTGLAGRHVSAALESRAVPVLRIRREAAAGWHVADLEDPAAVAALPPFSAVVHCAGLTPRRGDLSWSAFERTNVAATRTLADEAVRRGVSRFVLVSTLGRPGRAQQTPVGRRYVASKHLAERALRDAARGHMAAWIIRAASMYGEGDRGSMARLIAAIARGRFVLPGNGSQRKCLLYAGTLGELVAAELARPEWPAFRRECAYDLEALTLLEIVRAVDASVGRRTLKLPIPATLARAALAAAGRTPSARIRHAALGAAIALRDVACEGPNAVTRLPRPGVGPREGIRREVEWIGATAGR